MVTIESAVVAIVLGLVDDAGLGVNRNRLVGEASHRPNGHRRHLALCGRRNIEAVAMLLRPSGRRRSNVGLFTGDPRAPRGDAAGTIHGRPAQTDPVTLELTGEGIHHERGRATAL